MRRPFTAAAALCLFIAPLVLTGCAASLSPLQRHTAAFANATVLVTDGSVDAYRGANQLHDQEQLALAVLNYDKSAAWNPADYVKPLLSPDQLQARTDMLDGLKQYAESLADLTGSGRDKDKDKDRDKDLNTAAQNVGDKLQTLSTSVSTIFSNVPALTDQEKAGVSTGLRGLADVLKGRIVRRELPAILQKHDPDVAAICNVLDADIHVLRRQADRDYVTLEEAQDKYIRNPQSGLTAADRRIEIARLPAMVRAQQTNDNLLAKLQEAIRNLAKTHAALAQSAAGKNAASVQQLITELSAEGQSLAAYYQSLASPTTSTP